MPIEDDEAAEKGAGGNSNPSFLYKPWPEAVGTSFINELFIPLYSPAAWGMFNPTEESAKRLGTSLVNPLIVEGMPELYTFYFKVPTHKVANFQRPDGTTGFASVVCPVKLNYFLEKHIGRKPLFVQPRCPFCEAQTKAWAEHNARWKQLGIDKKSLSKDGYLSTVEGDAVLNETRQRAYSFNVQEKVVLNVFDHNKFTGERPLDEGESHAYRTWLAPKTILDGLVAASKSASKSGIPAFYDFSNPAGLQLVNVTKNTENCTAGNFRDTKYTCMMGAPYQYDKPWMNYLTNLGSMPDPSAAPGPGSILPGIPAGPPGKGSLHEAYIFYQA